MWGGIIRLTSPPYQEVDASRGVASVLLVNAVEGADFQKITVPVILTNPIYFTLYV